jgi:hypothetical protein
VGVEVVTNGGAGTVTVNFQWYFGDPAPANVATVQTNSSTVSGRALAVQEDYIFTKSSPAKRHSVVVIATGSGGGSISRQASDAINLC